MDAEEKAHPGLSIKRVRLEDLAPDPGNARTHGPANLEAIAESLRRFGQAEPLVVQGGTRRLVGGHGRLEAMRGLGWSECDVVELELEDVEAAALGLALNRAGELAGWDEPALASLLSGLESEGALEGLGFDSADIDRLLAGLSADDADQSAEAREPEPPPRPVTRCGDCWELGRHRLVCGDATDEDAYRRLLLADHADLVWTDPPYGVAYEGKTADGLTIQNDELRGSELERLLRHTLTNALAACRPGACWYVAAPAGPNFLPFAQVLTELGVWRQTLVWAKNALVLGRSDYHYRHEAIFYGWVPGAAHTAPPSRDQDTIWGCKRPTASPDHPTMKPVELVERALLNSSKRGEVVLDPFSGSGTTILACERTNRRGRGIELDPGYCDVILRRWAEASGGVPTLDGVPFDEVREERHAEAETDTAA